MCVWSFQSLAELNREMDNLMLTVRELSSILLKFFFIAFTHCGGCTDHSMHVEVRGQFMGVSFYPLGPRN